MFTSFCPCDHLTKKILFPTDALSVHTACTCLVHTPVEFELQHGFLELPRASCSVASQRQASAQYKTTHQHQSSSTSIVESNAKLFKHHSSPVVGVCNTGRDSRIEARKRHKAACFQTKNTTIDGQVLYSNLRALWSERAAENEPKKLKICCTSCYEISCTGERLCNTNV